MIYNLNYRFLIKFLVVTGIVLGALHFWHRRQAGKQVELLHHLAETAKKDDPPRPADEIRYLERYLALRPDDVAARERLGRVRYEQARTPRQALQAFLVLEEALRRDAKRPGLERFIVDVALDPRLGLVAEAHDHLNRLNTEPPTDGDIEGLVALCFEAEEKPIDAGAHYLISLGLKSDRRDSYTRFAFLLRRVKDPAVVKDLRDRLVLEATRLKDQAAALNGAPSPAISSLTTHLTDSGADSSVLADRLIESLVAGNPKSFQAHLDAARYWRAFGSLDQVRAAVVAAQSLAPNEADVILTAAAYERERAFQLSRKDTPDLDEVKKARDRARADLDRGIQLHPTLPAMYQARAELDADDGKLGEAEAVLQKGTKALPESADLWLALTDIKTRQNDPAGAGQALARYRELDPGGPMGTFQEARIDALREEWVPAAEKLSAVRDELTGTPFAKPANFLLARCYQQMGELDRRIEAYGRVLAASDPADPLWLPATVGVAEARAAQGQTEEALRIYQTLTTRAPGAWLAIARIRLAEQSRREGAERDFRRVEDALNRAAEKLPRDTTDLVVLRAQLLHLQGQGDAARKLLTKLSEELLANPKERKPSDVDVWIALATIDVKDGNPNRAQASAWLDEARQKLGDSVALRLARARLLINPMAPEAAAQFRALATETDSFSKSDKLRLVSGLADIAAAGGSADLAGDLWAAAASVANDNLDVQLRLFDRALQGPKLAEAPAVLERIKKIDGAEGPTYRAALAFYHIRQAQTDPTVAAEVLPKADRLLERVAVDRPEWSRVAFGQGLAADLRDDRKKAIERYQKAVEQGERDPKVIVRLVELLYRENRSKEAGPLLDKVPPTVLDQPALRWLVAEVYWKSGNTKAALDRAEKAINATPDDYQKLHKLAQMYWADDKASGKWEDPLRKAVARANGDPAPLVTLVQFLAGSGRRDEAVKAIDQFAGAVAADRRALTRALCLLAVGQTKEAGEAFEAASRERPDDMRVLRGHAEFLTQRGDFAAAGKKWEQVRNLPTATPGDREQAMDMIFICARLNPKQDYSQAVAMQEAAGPREGGVPASPTDDMSADELRRTARRLALRLDRASKVRAIEYLDRLEKVLVPTGERLKATDYFLRGHLRVSLNEPATARADLAFAVDADPKSPLYLAYYVAFLIRQQRSDYLEDAKRSLGELARLQPNEFRTAELTARLAAARGQKAEALSTLKKWEEKDAPVGRLAALYEELGSPDDAGRLYQVIGERTKRPEGLLPYAAFLGRRQQTEQALRRCEEARKQNCPAAAVAEVAVMVLYAAPSPDRSDIARVSNWISEALPKAGAQPAVTAALLNHQAALLNLEKRYAEAIAVYRRLLQIDARDATAMNNMAYLLAATDRPDFGSAFALLQKAKDVVGPLPELLDTEALIHLAKAKVEKDPAVKRQAAEAALALLGDVEVQAPSATGYFHLALAHAALGPGHEGEARSAWTEAKNRKLAVADLHPLERQDHEALRARFGG